MFFLDDEYVVMVVFCGVCYILFVINIFSCSKVDCQARFISGFII